MLDNLADDGSIIPELCDCEECRREWEGADDMNTASEMTQGVTLSLAGTQSLLEGGHSGADNSFGGDSKNTQQKKWDNKPQL